MNGFACITVPRNKEYIYVDLICGKGTGKLIFKTIEELAYQLKKNKIKLSAIPTAMMAYYGMYGFKFSEEDNCNQSETIKLLADELNDITKSKISILKSMSEKNLKKYITKEKHVMNKLLNELIKNRLTYDKGCKTKYECGIDGYIMVKCLS